MMYYDCYDMEEKQYFTISETKKFLALVMGLDYHKDEDRRVFKNIMT